MKKSKTSLAALVNLGNALVMLAMIVMLFVPYWAVETTNDDGSVETGASIAKYVFLPTYNPEIEDYLEDELGGEAIVINDEVGTPILLLVLGAFGVIFQLLAMKKRKTSYAPSILALPFGIAGVYGYLTRPIFKIGSLWPVHIALCAVALVLGLVGVVLFIQDVRKKEAAKK